MTPVLTLKNISLSYGHVALLDRVEMAIEPGERLCLVGRNGTGKTSLLKILFGEVPADEGERWLRAGLRVARLEQELPQSSQGSVYDVVADGLGRLGQVIRDYHHAIQALEHDHSEQQIMRVSDLQHDLEAADGWRFEQRIDEMLTKMGLPADQEISSLSGGMQRRVLLARALVTDPELLLLDEPTNHLDIEGITWLEEYLFGYNGALIFITHDRAFLQNMATRILELDRGDLTSWPGNYANYLTRREERLAAEASQNARFDKKLAQEEVWIRQGIKARRTRNEGRVRALKSLRESRQSRRDVQGKVRLNLETAESSGKIVAEVENISVGYEGKILIKDFSTRIMRGDRIGIIGPNGVGKTTLIRTLLGELKPESGRVKSGSKLQVAYFDQTRAQLDPEKTVIDNLNQGSDMVTVNGRETHVISYLQNFLFAPDRARSPVKSLSGGERNRLLLARLFTRPANVLVMDEPTNDLDVETLELLEELLCEYDGTLLLVSHDRAFLDSVVTSTIVFEGNGKLGEYVGGYQDWYDYNQQHGSAVKTATKNEKQSTSKAATESVKKSVKLSYKDQRELDSLPNKIETLESEQQSLNDQINGPYFYKQDQKKIDETLSTLSRVTRNLEDAYSRWDALDNS
ncbi:MAG TPA: ATP-binding cassette domain-containing protein [Gammaproteobacteria bacterium]|nr:ATP-binding cassette domain-containing protein [Gammaproteobacteria bacterium]